MNNPTDTAPALPTISREEVQFLHGVLAAHIAASQLMAAKLATILTAPAPAPATEPEA